MTKINRKQYEHADEPVFGSEEDYGITPQEMEHFKLQTAKALEVLAQRDQATRKRRLALQVLVYAGSAAAVLLAMFLPRWLSNSTGTWNEPLLAARLFLPSLSGETSNLMAGDQFTVNQGEVVIAFLPSTGTRQVFQGPVEIVANAAGDLVGDFMDQGSKGRTIQEWVISLKPLTAGLKSNNGTVNVIEHAQPVKLAPIDGSKVFPGEIGLVWHYAGPATVAILSVEDEAQNPQIDPASLDLLTGEYTLSVEPGTTYYWNVLIEGEVPVRTEYFTVITAAEAQSVRQAFQACGLGGSDLTTETGGSTDPATLGVLYEVCAHHGLTSVADEILGRLREIAHIEQ